MQQDWRMSIPAASVPARSIDIPDRVRELARDAALEPVWRNGIGGLTFRTDDSRFIKWGPLDLEVAMRDEAERMRWARRWLAVPEVLEQGQDSLLVDECPWEWSVTGHPVAHVDLAALGTGDRWADIAVAAMSTLWNYGEGWEETLIDAYGIAPDRERLAYYRRLWNET
jgi:kanamycin kinase